MDFQGLLNIFQWENYVMEEPTPILGIQVLVGCRSVEEELKIILH